MRLDMSESTGVLETPTTDPTESGTLPIERWGTASYFARIARVDLETAAYWVRTVYRPGHRIGHPFLSIDGCPGCNYETAAR
jgi:hypothetical protein